MKKMFKVSVAIMAAVVLFAGCTPEENTKGEDGIYNPAGKIKKVYFSSISPNYESPKELEEQWTWDGDLLKQTERIYNGESNYPINFQYDGKRISRIVFEDMEYVFVYNGSEIEKLTSFAKDNNNTELYRIDYKHENGKIVEQKIFLYEGFAGGMPPSKDFLRFFVSEKMLFSLDKIIAKRSNKSTEELYLTLSYEYEKDNVKTTTLVSTRIEGEITYKSTVKEEYTYDDKSNPFYNYPLPDVEGMATQLSKNNHTKITYSYIYEKNGVVIEEEVDGPYTYTYKYDGDLLVERTYTSDATSSSTTYYEY